MPFNIKDYLSGGTQPQETPGNLPVGGSSDPSIYGGSNQFLQSMLRRQTTGTNPAIMKARKAGRGAIGRSTDRGLRSIRENQASSGFRGGGANLYNQLFSGQSDAFGNLEANLSNQQTAYNQEAISNLLGLNQFQGGQTFNQLGLDENTRQFDLSDLFRNRQLQEQRRQFDESNEFNFGDFLGNVIGGGAQIGAAALSDKKTKKNIKYTGEKTKSGIPLAEFKYKGSDRKFKGVIAQDVEKVKPSAVFKVVDYSKIPDAIFEEVN